MRQRPTSFTPSGAERLPRLDERFVLVEPLGAGAQGQVFSAFDRSLGVPVALKLCSPEERAGLSLEARVLGHLDRAGVAASPRSLAWLALADGRRVLVTERLEGEDLRALAHRRTACGLPPLDRDTLSRALRALGEVHAAGVIHGDLKPEHLRLPASGGPARILDFGAAFAPQALAAAEELARARASWPAGRDAPVPQLKRGAAARSSEAARSALGAGCAAGERRAVAGTARFAARKDLRTPRSAAEGGETSPDEPTELVGSLPYLAPERFFGQPPTVASDLYALAACVLDAIGALAHLGDLAPQHWHQAHLYGDLRSSMLHCRTLEPETTAFVRAALEPDPWRRPCDCADALALLARGAPPRAPAVRVRRRVST